MAPDNKKNSTLSRDSSWLSIQQGKCWTASGHSSEMNLVSEKHHFRRDGSTAGTPGPVSRGGTDSAYSQGV